MRNMMVTAPTADGLSTSRICRSITFCRCGGGVYAVATDDFSNLMPACRMCNHYKRANSLEAFRRYIAEIPRKLRENYIYKVGVVYGNVVENVKPIEFYFEKFWEGEKRGNEKV